MRNNQDRFGPKTVSSDTPVAAKPTLNFVTPTEFVVLPSGGAYPVGHPLSGKDTIEIYYMTAKDEDILSSEALLKKGVAIERFIENVIVDKSIDASTLLTGDRNAIIIAARSSGYGNAYETSVVCPSCSFKSKWSFDLDKPTIKECKENEDIGVYKTEDGYFETKMPSTKYSVKFRLLTGKDEMQIVQEKMKKKKTKIAGLDRAVTNQFKRMIVAIEGYDDKTLVNRFVDTMIAVDSHHFKKAYKSVNPNVEIKSNFECESCGHQQELEVPLNADFFWPDA